MGLQWQGALLVLAKCPHNSCRTLETYMCGQWWQQWQRRARARTCARMRIHANICARLNPPRSRAATTMKKRISIGPSTRGICERGRTQMNHSSQTLSVRHTAKPPKRGTRCKPNKKNQKSTHKSQTKPNIMIEIKWKITKVQQTKALFFALVI